ncbi:23S rRNA (uracil(1939)-C(5))-methyltransferase RlmD [Pseudalkalibacillus salsuginis]|uniref:23S rRNA (uracil(1939)-C(5))-methyltransferase RlmD n=1 Tax=Pseudalkalibacillus salsuginis TaxID=2910972 RepID=UPI001F1C91DF|nr:23S rRNA (uracil(1939)-C(5))-methyltransferase RlmD [Pseudalkalibacillus salsuginis]MCF6411982.1 23S rRNA (uracil(1939)-C(5))-methyltransferase RlmD [Pseudalkalibacillus salsuginis]
MKSTETKLKAGDTIRLAIKRLGINGEGIGFYNKKVTFVTGALPGEEVIARVTKPLPNRIEAEMVSIKKRSKDRVKPPCPIYEQCGGCQLQHLRYEAQLKEKKDIVRQAFSRYTDFDAHHLPLKDTIGMEDPWNYRNKSQFQVAKKGASVLAGLYGLGSHKLIDLSNCMVQHPQTTSATNTVKKILEDLNISIYNERERSGIVRTIVTRVSFRTEKVQVVLITTQREIPKKDLLIKEMKKRLPEVTSILQNINGQKTSLIFGDETIHLEGDQTIQETLGDLSFELSARAFFQLNPVQTVKLYNEARKAAKLTGEEKVVDAYCGVGTIGLWLSERAGEVRGMDVIEESIKDANENAARHGINNATYVTGKAEELLPKWLKEGWKPDVIVVDPPRTGCDMTFLKTVAKIQPKRMVYVSCNPSTLAKDVDYLTKHSGFKIERLQPVDMFPHTAHVEAIATLVRK